MHETQHAPYLVQYVQDITTINLLPMLSAKPKEEL